jgi:hypothetical protein
MQTAMRRLFEQRGAPSDVAVPAVLFGALFCQVRRPAILSDGEKPGLDGMVGVRPGELVRVAMVLPYSGRCDPYFSRMRAAIGASPILSKLLVRSSPDEMTIRRPDGLDVRVDPVSPSMSGSNLRSTWLAGALFDDDLCSDAGLVGALDDALRAAWSRLLPGAIWAVVSHK